MCICVPAREKALSHMCMCVRVAREKKHCHTCLPATLALANFNLHRVSIAQEIDSIDSKSAAELALDTIIQKLAEYGRPAGGKHSTKSVVSVMLQPKVQASTPSEAEGGSRRRKSRSNME